MSLCTNGRVSSCAFCILNIRGWVGGREVKDAADEWWYLATLGGPFGALRSWAANQRRLREAEAKLTYSRHRSTSPARRARVNPHPLLLPAPPSRPCTRCYHHHNHHHWCLTKVFGCVGCRRRRRPHGRRARHRQTQSGIPSCGPFATTSSRTRLVPRIARWPRRRGGGCGAGHRGVRSERRARQHEGLMLRRQRLRGGVASC